MDIQWSTIWTQANAVGNRSRMRRSALADPLERAEWEGLGWAALAISRLVAGPRPAYRREPKTQQVERFTHPAPARSVCVS